MKQALKWQRILILSLLSLSVFAPIIFLSKKRTNLTSSFDHKEFIEDISNIKFTADTLKLNAIQQEIGKDLKEPVRIVYKDIDYISVDSANARKSNSVSEKNGLGIKNGNNGENQQKALTVTYEGKGQSYPTTGGEPIGRFESQKAIDEKVREMKDQLLRAKAYLKFAPPNSNSHLVKELKQRIKEIERAIGEANKDSDLSRRALQRMVSMEASLSKASQVYPDCSAMATKLRAMTFNTEEQVRAQRNQATYLTQLASRTFPKGLHCFTMRLTADYFGLLPEERKFSNVQKLWKPDLYHYAVFSDNILACAVVVNSTVSSSMNPEKTVFHVVTDALNLPAITMWFLANPPGHATIHVESIDNFKWLPSSYSSLLKQPGFHDPRYTLALNHLRFYLPEVFPELNKIVILDHDVVVQRDLSGLWKVDMKGKVNGAVQTCGETEPSNRMDMYVDFSDPVIAKKFDSKACAWAFGMNLFNLREWRRQDLTAVYHKWLQLGKKKKLFKDGSLPLGLVTFYNLTVALDRRWHVSGLGYNPGVGHREIERAAVLHYDGKMKPWLEIGIGKYRGYWNKFVQYDHPYLQQCNIHE